MPWRCPWKAPERPATPLHSLCAAKPAGAKNRINSLFKRHNRKQNRESIDSPAWPQQFKPVVLRFYFYALVKHSPGRPGLSNVTRHDYSISRLTGIQSQTDWMPSRLFNKKPKSLLNSSSNKRRSYSKNFSIRVSLNSNRIPLKSIPNNHQSQLKPIESY